MARPKLLLLDEPLSNLDARLRDGLRLELARLHRELGTTMIYVTHDQVEAMTLANRIVIMDKGVLQQAGPPVDVFNDPVNGGPVFGPPWWQHDAIVTGESRGKLWRTRTVKTAMG